MLYVHLMCNTSLDGLDFEEIFVDFTGAITAQLFQLLRPLTFRSKGSIDRGLVIVWIGNITSLAKTVDRTQHFTMNIYVSRGLKLFEVELRFEMLNLFYNFVFEYSCVHFIKLHVSLQ